MKLPGRSVYSTALVIFLAASLFLLGAAVLLTQSIILREFTQTEQREMRATLQRMLLVLDREMRPLEMTVADWGPSDDLFQYAGSEDPALAPRNLPSWVLANLNLDFAAVYGRDGRLRQLAVRDEEIREQLNEGRALTETLDYHKVDRTGVSSIRRSGFLLMGKQLAAIAVHPILRSNRSGPPAGLIVGGRILDKSAWAFFDGLFTGTIVFRTFENARISDVSGREIVDLLNRKQAVIQEDSPNKITGFTLIAGFDGKPLGVLSLTQSRPLRQEGVHASQIFLLGISLAGGFLVFVVWVLLDRTILARIRDLTRKLDAVKRSGRLPVQLNFRGDDELGTLAHSIEDLALRLQSTQSQYRAVVEDQTEMICRFDDAWGVAFANQTFLKFFGLEGKVLASCRLDVFVPEPMRQILTEKFLPLSPNDSLCVFTHELRLEGGGAGWFRSTLRRSFDRDGRSLGGQWVLTDITAQIEAQRQMLESERRFRRLYETASDGILLVGGDNFAISDVNQSLSRMLMLAGSEILGRTFDQVPALAPCRDVLDAYRRRRESGAQFSSCRDEFRLERANGSEIFVEVRCTSYEVGEDEFIQLNFRDISERVQGEQQLRRLSAKLLRLQDEERRRIARELHDSTAQNLSALEMNMSLLEPMLARSDTRAQRIISDTRRIASECSKELRNISYLLHPPLIDEVGLAFAIKWFADGFSKRTGIASTVEVDADFPRLDGELEMPLFRVVQEAMTNIYRHSGADHAWVSLHRDERTVSLEIRDNGRGFDEGVVVAGEPDEGGQPLEGRLGVGLQGMRERLANIGGKFDIESTPLGVTISIRLTLDTSYAGSAH